MAMCEKLAKCPFYQGKMTMDSGLGSMYKQKYCEGDKTICARYIVATTLGPNFVPDTLFPIIQKESCPSRLKCTCKKHYTFEIHFNLDRLFL